MNADGSVSVVIPAFNAARFLPDSVGSVRRQSLVIRELIVVDDGSDDDTFDLARTLGATTLRLTNGGAGRARRAGLDLVSGEFVLFLDADDRLRPEAVTSLRNAAAASRADLVSGKLVNILDEEFSSTTPNASAPYSGPLATATLIRRAAFELIGPFNDDNVSWLRWIAVAKRRGAVFQMIDEIVADRRIHSANVSRAALVDGSYFDVLREHVHGLRKNPPAAVGES